MYFIHSLDLQTLNRISYKMKRTMGKQKDFNNPGLVLAEEKKRIYLDQDIHSFRKVIKLPTNPHSSVKN